MKRGMIVRHLVLPGHADDSCRVLDLVWQTVGDVPISVMNQYTPVLASRVEDGDARAQRILVRYPRLGETVPNEEYERLLDYADSIGMEDYFWQEGPAAKESFIPVWDGSGVAERGLLDCSDSDQVGANHSRVHFRGCRRGALGRIGNVRSIPVCNVRHHAVVLYGGAFVFRKHRVLCSHFFRASRGAQSNGHVCEGH